MSRVPITGNAWSHGRDPIPAVQQPRLWMRPDKPHMVVGLMDSRGVQLNFNPVTGAFNGFIESFAGIMYTPVLEYLLPGQTSYGEGASGYEEWPAFFPGNGGDISSLNPFAGIHGLLFGFGDPPSHLNDAVYLDITGPSIRIFGPAGGNI